MAWRADRLCLAAFPTSAHAITWALHLVEALLAAPWEPELLSHEMCEVVTVGGMLGGVMPAIPSNSDKDPSTPVAGALERTPSTVARLAARGGVVLFRGLRLKVKEDEVGGWEAAAGSEGGENCAIEGARLRAAAGHEQEGGT